VPAYFHARRFAHVAELSPTSSGGRQQRRGCGAFILPDKSLAKRHAEKAREAWRVIGLFTALVPEIIHSFGWRTATRRQNGGA